MAYIKALFTVLWLVAVFGTVYYLGIVASLVTAVSSVRSEFTDFLPPEQLLIFGLFVLAIVIAIIYSFID